MRIRTIKPEFWSHPVMARKNDATKLLALGLLNYADDEGYFYADPAMVRAALRPLDEDSTIVRAAMKDLEEIGYIQVFLHSTHGLLGRVVSFTDHQRVDRPADSKIRVIWGKKHSSNNRRIIADQSPLEGKGKEQGTGKGVRASFDEFWNAYPKKKAKEEARKAFLKVDVDAEALVAAIEAAKNSDDWRKDSGKYIPYPATWLRGKRWEDEGSTATAAAASGLPMPDAAQVAYVAQLRIEDEETPLERAKRLAREREEAECTPSLL